jgi:hypothetical protein
MAQQYWPVYLACRPLVAWLGDLFLAAQRSQANAATLMRRNAIPQLTAESAQTRIMVLITHQGIMEAAPRPTASGVYHDQWRKAPAGWRLAHWILRRDHRA